MNGYPVFLVLLGIYLAALVAVGWYHNRRQRCVADFWLAGRHLGTAAIGFSAAASWLTAGALLAVTGFFMLSGMGSIWGFVAPNILALLLIALFVRRIKNLPAITQPELLEQRYGSAIRAPVAVIITVVMILFAVADIKGFAFMLAHFYGLGPVAAAVIVGLAVGIYVTLGGFSAVVWTDVVQFSFLAAFTLGMAVAVASAAMGAPGAGVDLAALLGQVPDNWWNPLSVGLPTVIVFILAIIPGWITEQDPWQRVWAARSEKAARRGMVLGSGLITLVFAGCAVIAVGLNLLRPEIAALGFPAGMAAAEPALLDFIVGAGFPPMVVALCAIGLAAAAMSCADTFAASGASCLSRDLYQRYLKPDATMGEMLKVNRISVLLIVLAATVASFLIDSIIDAIHIATFIASAAYFFPLMGGLYWPRATREGALAALWTGAGVQVALIAVDLAMSPPMGPAYLETLSPGPMGHGVIAGMLASGAAFVGGSLLTRPAEPRQLAPFFPAMAERLASAVPDSPVPAAAEYSHFLAQIEERSNGGRTRLQFSLEADRPLVWPDVLHNLKAASPLWVTPAGLETAYRLTQADLLACVSITRGRGPGEIWFVSEPRAEDLARQRQAFFCAVGEVAAVLASPDGGRRMRQA